MNEQLEFLEMIAARLEGAGIQYMVTGSVAMSAYATPRMTRDIDVVVDLRFEDADRIQDLFGSDCYVDIDSIRQALASKTQFNIIHNEWLIKADFIVRKRDSYRETEFSRRRQLEIEGSMIWVVAPEDLILSKLWWARESGSDMQKRDARTMARCAARLDWAYLEKWAGELGLGAALREVRE